MIISKMELKRKRNFRQYIIYDCRSTTKPLWNGQTFDTENGRATFVDPLSIPRTVKQFCSITTGNSVPPCVPNIN